MPGLGDHPRYMHRPQRYWLLLSVTLGLGLGAYMGMNHLRVEPPMAALLTVCAMGLGGMFLVLRQRLQLAWAQRDEALAEARETEWQISDLRENQELRVEQVVSQRVQALQTEIALLLAREQLLKAQAHHDDLTGLANRILLADRFHLAVERAKRSGKSFALFMIDLNDFKNINDHCGHAAGDAVLITVARRLVGAVRASDTVARLGGDEFVLIIESIEEPQELVHLGQKLIATLAETIALDSGTVLNVGASAGLAVYPDDGVEMNDLLCIADHAMYECKFTGSMSLQ